MRRGLLDYVADNPYAEDEDELLPIEETEEERLRRQIEEGIEKVAPAAAVLKDCLSLIGILAHNQTWADERKRKLERNEQELKEAEEFLS